MEQYPESSGSRPALVEQNREVATTEQISDIAASAQNYLMALHKKAGLMEEESHRPILTPDEHNYINRVISAGASLVRYWLEMPSVKMPPPDKLTDLVEVLRKSGTKLESTTEDILKDEDLFRGLLGRAASRQQHTSRLNAQENRGAVISAHELVELIELMAASNPDQLPYDYFVGISLSEIAKHPEGSEFKKLPPNTEGLRHLLDGLEPDRFGFIRLDEARRLKLETILRDWGAAVQPPGPEEIQDGIESARNLVKEGKAEEYLKAQKFVDWEDIPRSSDRAESVVLGHPIYITPDSIVGAQSFEDWRGRSSPTLKQDDMGDKKPSTDVIVDYATRGTPLPTVELDLIPQEDGQLILYAENAHRVAAARLRSEPLAVSGFRIYK